MPGFDTIATWDQAGWLVAWLDFAVRGALLLGAATLLVGTLRRASAATRHLVWSLAMLGLVVLPVLTWTLPSWRARLPQRADPLVSRLAAVTLAAHMPTELATLRGAPEAQLRAPDELAVPAAEKPQRQPATLPESAPTNAAGHTTSLEPRTAAASNDGSAASGSGFGSSAAAVPWLTWVLPLWGIGALLAAAWFALQHGSVRYLASRAQPETDATILRRVERARSQVGIARSVRVLRGGAGDTPMTWGLRHAVLLLPHGMPQWPLARQRDVLLHELAHIKRHDHAAQLLAQLACALHWFNPLAWHGARRMVLEREHACDDFVLNAGVRASDYAQHLLDVAHTMRTRRLGAAAAIAMAGRSTLPRRLRAVLEPQRSRRGMGRSATLLALVLAAALVVPLAALDIQRAPHAAELPQASVAVAALPIAQLPPSAALAVDDVAAAETSEGVAVVPRVDTGVSVAVRTGVGTAVVVGDGGSTTEVSVEKGRWNFSWRDGDERLRIRARGEIELNDDLTDVVSLSHRGYIDLEEQRGGDKWRVKLRGERDGSIKRQWWIDGKERPYDDEAAAWLADTLPEFTRRAGFAVDQRVAALLSRDGVDAVLQEIEQVDSDRVVRLYFDELSRQADLDAQQLERVLEHAGEAIGSDYELAQLLIGALEEARLRPEGALVYARATMTIGSDYEQSRALRALVAGYELEEAALREVLAAAMEIGSDFEQARLLLEIAREQDLTPPLHRAFFEAMRTIGSDYEHRRVLKEFVAREDLAADLVEDLLRSAARSIGSDYELAELLVQMAKRGDVQPAWVPAYLEALETVGSDYEFRRAAQELLHENQLDDASLVLLLEVAEHELGSDFEMTQLLVQVARRYELSGATREAYLRASDTIGSSHENRRALSALVESER